MIEENNAVPVEISGGEMFGDADVVTEIERLKNRSVELYLEDTRFSKQALDDGVYLISGRRGTGKSALSRYYSFQKQVPDVVHIEIPQNDAFPKIFSTIAREISTMHSTQIKEMAKIWEVVIWSLIREHLPSEKPTQHLDKAENAVDRTPAGRFMAILGAISRSLELEKKSENVQTLVETTNVATAIKSITEQVAKSGKRIIVSLDTMEKYDAHDKALMMAIAALIEVASNFNLKCPSIQVKVFLPGELFGYIEETILSAPAKHIRSPLHLIWSPSDLLRMIMWRFWKRLNQMRAIARLKQPKVTWSDAQDVYKRMWKAHFVKDISDGGIRENSFQYILRHTQLRPRQMIKICNAIAARSDVDAFPPKFDEGAIRTGIDSEQGRLVADVISSFAESYPNVGHIVNVLAGTTAIISEEVLLKHAEMSRAYWPHGHYSPDAFRDLLAELGVIGRINAKKPGKASVVEAEFTYSTGDKIVIGRNEDCVIHPMFHRRLGTKTEGWRVLPLGQYAVELEKLIR